MQFSRKQLGHFFADTLAAIRTLERELKLVLAENKQLHVELAENDVFKKVGIKAKISAAIKREMELKSQLQAYNSIKSGLEKLKEYENVPLPQK